MKRSIGLLVVFLAGCSTSTAATLSDADRAGIQEVTDAYVKAALAGDADGLSALYTEDAVLMDNGAPAMKGRAAIGEFMKSYPPVTSFDHEIDDIDGAGDVAYVRGHWTIEITPPEASPITMVGKYIEIRRRQPDGRWLIAADIFNTDAAPAVQSEPAEKAIAALNDQMAEADNTKNTQWLMSSFFTDDAVRMPPHEPAQMGAPAIRKAIAAEFDQFTQIAETTKIEKVHTSGDLAVAWGSFTWRSPFADTKKGVVDDEGKWSATFLRQPDGSWKCAQLIWNSDKAAPGS